MWRYLKHCTFSTIKQTSSHLSTQATARTLATVEPIDMSFKMFTDTHVDNGASPLIIMHGLLGSKQNWNGVCKSLMKVLNPRRKIITVDARNHGDSPHSPYHSYAHLAEDVAELLRKQNIERATIMGHSMGGRAMMYFALRYPNLVDKAIIVDISPVRSSADLAAMDLIFSVMKSVKIPADLSITEGRKKAYDQLLQTIKNKQTVDFIMLNLKKGEREEFSWKPNVDSLHRNFSTHISKFPDDILKTSQFRNPVVFIGGTNSDFIIQSDVPKIKEIFPNAEFKWLEAGHLVHIEKPAEFQSIVVDFLR